MSTQAEPEKLDSSRKEFYQKLLKEMMLIRFFEEKAAEAYATGSIGGFCHLYIGQEAVAVGSIAALNEDDVVFASYREHGHALTKGVSPNAVMAELFGKSTGCSAGKGGSMHMFDASCGFLGGHGIVGAHIPLAAGAAFAMKYRNVDLVSACYFGEAAVNNGAFHETLNMAALWKLPVVFICENNRYGMGTALERASAIYDIHHRSCSYDMDSEVVDGMDVMAMYDATARAVARARSEKTPTLIEARTYRFMGHSMSDPIHGHYRTREEVEEQKKKDPIITFFARLEAAGLMTADERDALQTELIAEVDAAVEFAEQSADPDPSQIYADVYAD